MNTKSFILNNLERRRGEYVSGAVLASETGVSRQAVGKAVKSLQADGYEIYASPNKGYMLCANCDIISASVIENLTGAKFYSYASVTSTNAVAMSKFHEEGECAVISLSQTRGRKKDGGIFYSPSDKGIYFSAAMKLHIRANDYPSIRRECAEIVCETIASSCGVTPEIKNTDEIFIDGKKVCGILIECAVNTASELSYCAVIGIGIYTSSACFDDTALSSVTPNNTRNKIIAELYLKLKDKFKKYATT